MNIMPARTTCPSAANVITVLAVAALCSPCAADQPLEEVLPLLNDTTASCESIPNIDRAMGVDALVWNGHEYLIANLGNELGIWNTDAEQAPVFVTQSLFDVGNQGDSDYDLLAFSVCDDCRFGVANFKLGTVLFDLGEGTTPDFAASELYGDADDVLGGFTFKFDDQQFLVASDLPDECSTTASTVYALDGVFAADLNPVTCIDADIFQGVITAGHSLVQGTEAFAYLVNEVGRVLVFELVGPAISLTLDFKSSPTGFRVQLREGFDLDMDAEFAVTAYSSVANLWDLANPALPVAHSVFPIGDETPNLAAVSGNIVWMARKGTAASSMTFDVSDPANPVPLADVFWDPAQPWNSYGCTTERAGRFSGDGSVLYLARYGVLQAIVVVDIFSNDFESGTTDMWSVTVD